MKMTSIKELKAEVDLAIGRKKTFTMVSFWQPLQRALETRDWVERLHPKSISQSSDEFQKHCEKSIEELESYLKIKPYKVITERIIKSKLLKDHEIDLIWFDDCFLMEEYKIVSDKFKFPLVNKFKVADYEYTSKSGLSKASKLAHLLYGDKGAVKISHPRSYLLSNEWEAFWEDFNITSAISLLKYVQEMHENQFSRILSPAGKISLETFEFAVKQCTNFLKRHNDMDYVKSEKFNDTTQEEWDKFHENYFQIVHFSHHFKQTSEFTDEDIDHLVAQAKKLLSAIASVRPFLEMDGYSNIWILKPDIGGRCWGIIVRQRRETILQDLVNKEYVAQKYIERPLLIYDTKFDIRQWYLITETDPLTIWMWKECHLRFSTQTYSIRKLHESIHLTGNCLQTKYLENRMIDPGLPDYLMWSGKQFRQYLSNIGYPNVFKDIISPGMKQDIISATIFHKHTFGARKNCFQLYGADFMITTDFKPWLIEINHNPDFSCQNPVKSELVPRALEDNVRVVLDYRENKKADTGAFELIYQENMNHHHYL